mgnify:CR=1 FL=1
MQTIYNAQNDIDAQLVVDRLAAENIQAHVFGRFLSSASGELPAQSMVRVQVDDDDAERALRIVAEWQEEMNAADDNQSESTDKSDVDIQPRQPIANASATTSGFGMLLVGMFIGVFGTYAILRLPPTEDEIDYDKDGIVDERYFYRGELLSGIDYDRNGDGEVDFRFLPSHKNDGDAIHLVDDDFDGRFENRDDVRNGWTAISEYDTDGDGLYERKDVYRHGVIEETIHLIPPSGDVVKREYLEHGTRVRSEADLNHDGVFETRWTFDKIGEPLKVELQE